LTEGRVRNRRLPGGEVAVGALAVASRERCACGDEAARRVRRVPLEARHEMHQRALGVAGGERLLRIAQRRVRRRER